MKSKYRDFEDFLMAKCNNHTNNSPEGFERWLESLDLQEMQDYGEEWGELRYLEGKEFVIEGLRPMVEEISKTATSRFLGE
jgi:hypothetical protein